MKFESHDGHDGSVHTLEGFQMCDTGVLSDEKNSFVIVPSEDSHDLWEMEDGASLEDLITFYREVDWIFSGPPRVLITVG